MADWPCWDVLLGNLLVVVVHLVQDMHRILVVEQEGIQMVGNRLEDNLVVEQEDTHVVVVVVVHCTLALEELEDTDQDMAVVDCILELEVEDIALEHHKEDTDHLEGAVD